MSGVEHIGDSVKLQNSWTAAFASPLKGVGWPLLAWFTGPFVYFGALFLSRPAFAFELASTRTALPEITQIFLFRLPGVPFRLAFLTMPLAVLWFVKARHKEDPASVIDLTRLGQLMAVIACVTSLIWAPLALGHLAEMIRHKGNIQAVGSSEIIFFFLTSFFDFSAAATICGVAAALVHPRPSRLPKHQPR